MNASTDKIDFRAIAAARPDLAADCIAFVRDGSYIVPGGPGLSPAEKRDVDEWLALTARIEEAVIADAPERRKP